jgi:hypothetical protein
LLFDDLTTLQNCSNLEGENAELCFLEVFNSLLALSDKVSVCLTLNRDCFLEEGVIAFYRDLKLEGRFDYIFETIRNEAGYSKDVHGQLNFVWSKHKAELKYKLKENRIDLFTHFTF